MDYQEIKRNQKLVKRHGDAYSVGRHSDTENFYKTGSEKWLAFNLGRLARVTYGKRK